METLGPLCTAGGKVKWRRCFGQRCGASSKSNQNYPMTLQFHFGVHTLKNQKQGLEELFVQLRSQQHH